MALTTTPTQALTLLPYHSHHHSFHSSTPSLLLLRRRPNPVTLTAALPPAAVDLPPLALPAAAAAAALATAISLSDPDRRRRAEASAAGGSDKEAVRAYFNSIGFDRWRKIYGSSTDSVNSVQLDIRLGHAQTVEATLTMLKDSFGPSLAGTTVCDAGCGTGSLALPLAREGAVVSASDISAAMVSEAQRLAREARAQEPPNSSFRMPAFEVKDLESLDGKYDIVVCLDVLIHYPTEEAEKMIRHLASLAEKRLLISFAPKTFYFDFLKRVGELFPGPSKATRAYLHAERDIKSALHKAGWQVKNRGFISTQFYFAKLFEAVPIGSV